jgi:cytochrome P450
MTLPDAPFPIEVDFADPDVFAEGPPFDIFAKMREAGPTWSPTPADWPDEEGPGYWNITRAAEIAQVSHDSETFSSYERGFCMRSDEMMPLEALRTMMIAKDAPEHGKQRGTISRTLTPRRTSKLEPVVRGRINDLIDAVIEVGKCDFMTDIARPFTCQTIAVLLGVPESGWDQLLAWTDSILAYNDPEMAVHGSGEQAMIDAMNYLAALIAEREMEPRDDLITAIGQAEVDGQKMPIEEQAGLFIQLFAAGLDTTSATMGFGMDALINNPDQRQALLDEPELIGQAVEEILRWAIPTMYQRRTAMKDTEIGGTPIAKGDSVLMWYISGSRDPEAVSDPDRFDVRRSTSPHQAFGGGGRHSCPGASLARMELRVAFEELLRRMPDMQLDEPPERIRTNMVQGFKRMPVSFTPGPRQTPAG